MLYEREPGPGQSLFRPRGTHSPGLARASVLPTSDWSASSPSYSLPHTSPAISNRIFAAAALSICTVCVVCCHRPELCVRADEHFPGQPCEFVTCACVALNFWVALSMSCSCTISISANPVITNHKHRAECELVSAPSAPHLSSAAPAPPPSSRQQQQQQQPPLHLSHNTLGSHRSSVRYVRHGSDSVSCPSLRSLPSHSCGSFGHALALRQINPELAHSTGRISHDNARTSQRCIASGRRRTACWPAHTARGALGRPGQLALTPLAKARACARCPMLAMLLHLPALFSDYCRTAGLSWDWRGSSARLCDLRQFRRVFGLLVLTPQLEERRHYSGPALRERQVFQSWVCAVSIRGQQGIDPPSSAGTGMRAATSAQGGRATGAERQGRLCRARVISPLDHINTFKIPSTRRALGRIDPHLILAIFLPSLHSPTSLLPPPPSVDLINHYRYSSGVTPLTTNPSRLQPCPLGFLQREFRPTPLPPHLCILQHHHVGHH
ncbi:hypothetical protein V8E36_000992 [Tilletia maclaganii]